MMYDIQTLTTYVGESHAAEIYALLTNNTSFNINSLSLKSPKVAMLLAIFTGILGLDRLYQGGIKMMLVKWATLLFTLFTWSIADIHFTAFCVREDNYHKILTALA